MNKNLIKKNYKKKIDLFNRYNKKYFDENISEISDFDFDKLKREILDLEKEYDFSFNPDLIVIKIGTNDFGGEMNVPPDMTDSLSFSDAYMEFLQYVTQKNPNAKIVLAVGGGITDFYPIGLKRLSRFKSWVKIIKEIADKEFSNKFGFFEFQPQNPPYGEDWHPTLISQKKFAAEITPYLIEFMKW